MFDSTDTQYMKHALAQAALGMYITTPNPRVGCVLVKNGQIIGQGFTQPAGQDHAEIRALKDASARGNNPQGATAYVSLEPCNHTGRTPPCTQALIQVGIARVIAAIEDPDPLVSGKGLSTLKKAGIAVQCGLLAREASELNIGFMSRMTRHKPWVRLKIAASLDGQTALPGGESQWITNTAARTDGHIWRARACAILTGIGTVLSDDPQLTVRGFPTPRQPQRILIDRHLRVPLSARILQLSPSGQPPLVVCGSETVLQSQHADALRARGVEVMALPLEQDNDIQIDLHALLRLLGERGINELHVEAGQGLNRTLWQSQCVDELLIYLAPTLLGHAKGMFDFTPPDTLSERCTLSFHSVTQVGHDLRLLARVVQVCSVTCNKN